MEDWEEMDLCQHPQTALDEREKDEEFTTMFLIEVLYETTAQTICWLPWAAGEERLWSQLVVFLDQKYKT